MIIFSPRKLEKVLSRDALAPKEKTNYLFLTAVVTAIGEPFYLVAPVIKQHEISHLEIAFRLIAVLLSLLITYWGITRCYKLNNTPEKFIERFICLRVPWTLLFALTLGPINLAFIYLSKKQLNTLSFQAVSAFIGPVTIMLFYLALSSSFKRLSCEQVP